jgi:uncharacterized membrane protein
MSTTVDLLSNKDIFDNAWQKVYGTKKIFFFGFLLTIPLVLMSNHIFSSVKGNHTLVLAVIAIEVIRWIVIFGILNTGVQRALDKPISIKTLFKIWNPNLLIKLIGFNIIGSIIFFVAIAVFCFSDAMIKDLITNSHLVLAFRISTGLLVLSALIYTLTRMFCATALIMAEDKNPFQAIKISFALTDGYSFKILIFYITQMLVLVVSAIPFGIGFIWTLPLMPIAYGILYRKLRQV